MMVLKTEWVQLETIELKSESALNRQDNESANTANNDNKNNKQLNTAIVGSVNNNINIIKSASGNPSIGFGFGITGNKSTGVVVKAITIGGSAHKDGRLKINDQIYQIGDVNVRSMSSEQVAAVLRQSALHDKSVQFIVARPVQHISVDLIDKSKSNDKSNLDDCTGLNRNLIDLNNLNSNQECFFIPTNEIMDKNVDLKQRLRFEMDKRKSFKTQNTTNENVQDNKLEIKHDLGEAKEEEEEILDSSCYLIELIKKTEKTTSDSNANINEMIIQNLKINYSIQISIETIESINYLIVIDDILISSNEFYEQFDQIIQIEKYKCDNTLFTLDRVILDQLFQTDKLKLKLKKNFHLKQTKLSEKWKNILKKSDNNNDCEIVISQIDKKASKGLGISLEGTVDIDAYGNETCCHHYIRSIMSNGTVDQSIQMKFQPMDELLQIDSFKLYAINYLDLLNILKNLSNKLLTFVCARKIKANVIIQLPTPATALPPPSPPPQKPLDLPKEPSLEPPPPPPSTINNSKSKEKIAFPNLIRSRSLELSNLAMWSKHIHYINLIKGPNGLGFSLIDYQQDPIIKPFSKSIIVIRALVANGVSQLDGRLVPGQRLISINDFDLNADTKNDLLKLTVNYLKSLPVGESVRLGIQKPLPFPIINADTNSNKKSTKSTLNLTTEPIARKKIKTITTSHYNLESTLSTSEKQIISSTSSTDSNSNNSIDDSESSTLDSLNKTKKNNYCLAAISAPSLLTSNSQEQSNDDILLSSKRSNKTHLFYSSSSLAKLEKESLLNKLDDIKIRKISNSLNNNKNNTEEDDLLFDKNNFLNFQIMPTLALEEEEIVETLISFDDNKPLKKPNKLQISNVDTSTIINSNNVSDSVVLLNFLVNTKKLNNNKKSKLHNNIQLIDNSDDDDDEDIEVEEELDDNDDDRNKHLITEEQFNQAFIINTNKKLKTLKEQNSFNSYELTDEAKVVATVAVEEEDFSDLIILKQHENNETSLENIKNLNLKEMVKEMATFDWPQLTNSSQTSTDNNNNNNNNNKETTQILEINVEKTEPIKTASVVATTTKSSLSSSSRYRSTSASRSIHCSGGFITTPDNLRRRKRFLKVRKKYCSAHGSRDMSSLTISGNNNNTTNNTSLLLNLSKNSFNVRSRSSSVKIINILGKEIIKLPLCLEREIKIKKEFKTLGISLVDSNVDEGVNGCCILKIEKNSACFNDARLQVGDYLIAINNEHLRNVSNSSARAILNRATLTSSEYLLVVFIPLNDALQYVEQFNKIHGSSFKLSNSSKNISAITTATTKTKNGRKIEKTLKKISKLKSPSSTSVSSTRSSSSNSSISSIDSSSSSSSSSLSSTCSCSNDKKHLNLSKFSLSLDISKKSTNHSKTGNNNNNNNNYSKNLTKSLQSIENMNNTIQTSKSKDNITTINNNNKATDVWGPIRTIVLERAQNNTSLGISIVGGKFELNNNAQPMNGIFIKHVSDKSVASQNGQIKIGDRIISVNDFDLTNVTHEKAVEIIRSALSPVKFVIQSLISSSSSLVSSKSDDDLDNNHNDQNLINNKYQYSLKMINKKYAFLLDPDSSNTTNNKLYIFRIKRANLTESLGLGLTGNSDPNKTSVFVCNIYKDSVAEQHGLFKVGDQILEINGHCVYGRSHSNVTPLIRSIKELEIYFIVLRNKDYLNEMFIPSNKEPTNNNINETIIISDPTPFTSSTVTATTTNEENKEIQLKRVTFDKPCKQVKLSKGVTGFGIAICEDRFHRLIVRGLNPNGVAYQDGRIEIGDEIIAINDVKISSLNYDEIMNKLHTTLEPVEFTLIKPERLATTTTEDSSPSKLNTPVKQTPIQQETAAAASPPPPPLSPQTQPKSPIKQSSIIKTTTTTSNNDPKTNKIKMGEETLIEIERGKLGLGLSIVGGFDTQLPGIIIHDIYQNGAAFLDKRLTIGDQILKVNNIDLTNATHEQALNALRQTSDSVRLLIHRGFINTNQSIIPPTSTDTCSGNTFGVRLKSNNEDININKYLDGVSNYEDEKLLNILSIDLNKKFAKGLGFSIIGRRTGGSTDGSGVFISHIIEGGCAHKDGRLMVGDLILEVNGQDIRKSSYNNVAFLLKTLPQGKVNLKIGRLKLSASNSTQNSQNTSKQGSRRGSFIFGSKN